MRIFLRILAGIVAVVAVLLLVLGIEVFNLRTTLLSPAFVARWLEREAVYARLPALIIDTAFEEMSRSPDSAAMAEQLEQRFGRQALTDLVTAILDLAWLQQQAEDNIEALFAWLDGETDYPAFRFDISDIGERAAGEQGEEAFRRLLAHLPPCAPGEDFLQDEFPHCRPPDAELDAAFETALPGFRRAFAQDWTFRQLLDEGLITADIQQTMATLRTVYQGFAWGVTAVWLATLALLGLMLLLAARSWDGLLRWSGWPLLIAGLLSLVSYGLRLLAMPWLLSYGMNRLSADSSVPQTLLAFGEALAGSLARSVFGRGLACASALTLVGLGMVVAASLLRRRRSSAFAQPASN